MEAFSEIFKLYDQDDKGFLTSKEFTLFEDDLGYKFDQSEKLHFSDPDKIKLNDIINAINNVNVNPSYEELLDAFRNIDKDNSGKIYVPVLINILKKFEYFQSPENIDELLMKLPVDDHYVFYKKMRYKN